MTRKRNLFGKDWSDLRAEINKVVEHKKFSADEFRALSMHDNWKEIENKIYNSFYNPTYLNQRPDFLWRDFKHDTFSVSDLKYRPEHYLDQLIFDHEKVWYLVNETINETTKYWIYEGKIKHIQIIIHEVGFDELCIVSKKYDWLICINHHDILIATGYKMIEKFKNLGLKEFQEQNN